MLDRVLTLSIGGFLLTMIFYLALIHSPEVHSVKRLLLIETSVVDKPSGMIKVLKAFGPEDIIPIKCNKVDRVTYSRVPDLSDLQPEKRKKRFIELILPSILIANEEILNIRKSLVGIMAKKEKGIPLTSKEKVYLSSILRRCRADSPEEILLKANPVPPSLIIAQAAIETGWGTSRFFTEGNNLFGVWTFRRGKDVLRARGASVNLRKYPTVLDSVRSYLYTLNVGWAFEDFRIKRLQSFNPYYLSNFMHFYSIERERYVSKIKKIIRENDLTRFDHCLLSDNAGR